MVMFAARPLDMLSTGKAEPKAPSPRLKLGRAVPGTQRGTQECL